MKYSLVLGFEIHVELSTKTKMFCSCPADHFGKTPNTQTCPVCLGLPGALPVPNREAINRCIRLGLALDCRINLKSKFDRKNYFYPDLPKGYQISQYDQPFCQTGKVSLSTGKVIHITRVHMEEDTGKLQHGQIAGNKVTFIDFNRSGVPLVEIVTEPDFDNPDEALEFLREIQQIIRTLDISSADMEKGSMRLEANISVRPEGDTRLPGYKVEVKNVNSFNFIRKAILFEYQRQVALLEKETKPVQETRGYNEETGETFSQRIKEEAHDYRYFPEPDIPPFVFAQADIDSIRSSLPPLPSYLRHQLVKSGLPYTKASTLVSDPKKLSMYTILIQHKYTSLQSADLVLNAPSDKLSDWENFKKWHESKQSNLEIDQKSLREKLVKIVESNPKIVSDYKSGKTKAIFSLIGQARREIGNVDVSRLQNILSDVILSQ